MITDADDIINAFEETDSTGGHYHTHYGLSKREYFSGLAMQGGLANGNPGDIAAIVRDSVYAADMLILELNKKRGATHE